MHWAKTGSRPVRHGGIPTFWTFKLGLVGGYGCASSNNEKPQPRVDGNNGWGYWLVMLGDGHMRQATIHPKAMGSSEAIPTKVYILVILGMFTGRIDLDPQPYRVMAIIGFWMKLMFFRLFDSLIRSQTHTCPFPIFWDMGLFDCVLVFVFYDSKSKVRFLLRWGSLPHVAYACFPNRWFIRPGMYHQHPPTYYSAVIGIASTVSSESLFYRYSP